MNSEILFRSYFSHSLCSSWMIWIKYLVIWHNNRVATGTIFFVVRILEFRWPNYFYNFDSRVQFLRVSLSLSLSLMVRFVSCCQRFACNMRPSNVYYIYIHTRYIPTYYICRFGTSSQVFTYCFIYRVLKDNSTPSSKNYYYDGSGWNYKSWFFLKNKELIDIKDYF